MQAGQEELQQAGKRTKNARRAAEEALARWKAADVAAHSASAELLSGQKRLDEEEERLESWKKQVLPVIALCVGYDTELRPRGSSHSLTASYPRSATIQQPNQCCSSVCALSSHMQKINKHCHQMKQMDASSCLMLDTLQSQADFTLVNVTPASSWRSS